MRTKVTIISAATVLALGGGFLLLKPLLSDRAETPAPPYIKASSSPKGRGEDLTARYEYDRLRLQDPALGRIPPNIRAQEIAFAKRLNQRNRALGKTIPGQTAALTWTERGPNNIGGRTRALAIDAADATRLLAGGVSGGMWLSTDGGASWNKTTGASQLHSVTAVVQDTRPGKTGTWYYGTGEFLGNSADANKGSAFYFGNGLFKSIDGGVSWSSLASTTGTISAFDKLWDYVWNVVVDTSNADSAEVYAATYSTIYRSMDGGTNWTAVLGGWLSSFSPYTDVAITSTGVVYATMSSAGDSAGIWRSTDGTTWTDITPIDSTDWPTSYGRVTLAIAPSNENVVYFLAEGTGSAVDHDLWKYTHDGSWENRTANLPNDGGDTGNFNSQGGYDLIVKVKPDDENFVIIGGTVLYRSTDGFATDTSTTRIGGYASANSYSSYTKHHPDQHALVFYPGAPDTVYSGHDGGISRTFSIAAPTVAWDNLNTGYNVTQFYTIAIDYTTSSDYLLGGTQDNGNLMLTASGLGDWFDPWFGGDGAYTAFAPGFSGSGAGGTVYVSTQNGALGRRKNVTDAWGAGAWEELTPTGATGMLFINPFALDPGDSDVMYFPAGNELWRSNDVSTSANWTNLTNAAVATGYTIGALGVTTEDPAHRLYFGAYSSGTAPKLVYLDSAHVASTADTTVDISPSSGNWPTGGWVSSIAVNPDDGDEILVALSNYNISSLWHSADAGTTWAEVEGNLTGSTGPSVRSATILPLATGTQYFIGTSTGVYTTTQLDSTDTVWVAEGETEIGNVVVDMVVSRTTDGLVAAGTHGRGVFTAYGGAVPNQPPLAFALVAPTDNATVTVTNTSVAQDDSLSITWRSTTDPEGDIVTYDIVTTGNLALIGFTATTDTTVKLAHKDLASALVDAIKSSLTGTWTILAKDGTDSTLADGPFTLTLDGSTLGNDPDDLLPMEFALHQNYPNPFNPGTTLRFDLPRASELSIVIYDMLGREVVRLVDGQLERGRHAVVWNGKSARGGDLPAGLYIARMSAPTYTRNIKMILLK